MITAEASKVITGIFKNRWRTLMSVDDLIADVISTVEELGLLDSTYFFYSSDHGFQLGQFNIPMDKRHVYEWDTRIHLLARGPGIAPGSVLTAPGTQVDVAPTLLGLAGATIPGGVDGKSVLPFLLDVANPGLLESTRQHLSSLGDLGAYRAGWRTEVFVEYYYCSYNYKCVVGCKGGDYPNTDSNCANLANNSDCWCGNGPRVGGQNCYATEDEANNFIGIRRLGPGENELYAEFQRGDLSLAPVDFDRVDFVEHYNVDADPWQMRNLVKEPALAAHRAALSARLREWLVCSGKSCP